MSRIPAQSGGDPRITVAVLDGPVDLAHPCFEGAALELPAGQPSFDPQDAAARHGTHVASIIFGQPGSPVEGIAPRCRGLILPVFSGGAVDGLRCSQLDLARAVLSALEDGVHIINISGGELSLEGEADGFLADALAKCDAAGVLVIAAAGNDGCDCMHLPAAVPTVLAVGAMDARGAPLPFSNWSAGYSAHGILAPGEEIPGAQPGGGTARRTGTSFAAPIVAGIAARMLADQLSCGETPDALKVRQALIGTAISCDPRDGERCLAGRLNAAGAILELNGGNLTMSSAAMNEQEYSVPEAVLPSAGDGADFAMERSGGQTSYQQQGMTASDCGCGCGGEKKKDCGCGCGGAKAAAPQKVFALGQIGYDFGTEARRDSIKQFLPEGVDLSTETLLDALAPGDDVQPEVERIIWLLKLDQTPIYAIRPAGAFAFDGYAKIIEAMRAQSRPPVPAPPPGRPKGKGAAARKDPKERADLFSIAGVVTGTVRLMSGETVPVLTPSARGIIEWNIRDAYDGFAKRLERSPLDEESERIRQDDPARFYAMFSGLLGDFRNLMTRKYRNLGQLGRERALNFAAMTAFTVFDFLREMIGLNLIIDDISVSGSPACRPGSECYDVQIRTFRQSDVTASLRVFQFTLDVSDTLPVDIGNVAIWSERPKA